MTVVVFFLFTCFFVVLGFASGLLYSIENGLLLLWGDEPINFFVPLSVLVASIAIIKIAGKSTSVVTPV